MLTSVELPEGRGTVEVPEGWMLPPLPDAGDPATWSIGQDGVGCGIRRVDGGWVSIHSDPGSSVEMGRLDGSPWSEMLDAWIQACLPWDSDEWVASLAADDPWIGTEWAA